MNDLTLRSCRGGGGESRLTNAHLYELLDGCSAFHGRPSTLDFTGLEFTLLFNPRIGVLVVGEACLLSRVGASVLGHLLRGPVGDVDRGDRADQSIGVVFIDVGIFPVLVELLEERIVDSANFHAKQKALARLYGARRLHEISLCWDTRDGGSS